MVNESRMILVKKIIFFKFCIFVKVLLNFVDFFIFVFYLVVMFVVGFYFMCCNKDIDDYYVGGCGMSSGYIGLSVVVMDVGGGFSIGLGGLGFVIGLVGSWMFFIGLVGVWLLVYFLILKIFGLLCRYKLFIFLEVFYYLFNVWVVFLVVLVSVIGYIGFIGV